MRVNRVNVSMFATNCYIVSCPSTSEAVVIDSGANGVKIMKAINNLSLKVVLIVNTHCHIDHVGANGYLKEKLRVPLTFNQKDLQLYENPGFGLRVLTRKLPKPDYFIKDGDILKIGDFCLSVIETPGHTPGGISLYGNEAVFCGDILFKEAIGRTDLKGGSSSELYSSIKNKLFALPKDTTVYPGHGPFTTIDRELGSNPSLAKLE